MKKLPTVSVLITTYNHEKFIEECIDGVLKQKTDFVYEIVIGDDCSTDRTRKICQRYARKYPDKINLICNKKNIGSIVTWQNALNVCIGKYIALCDGDDYWVDPYKLQKQVHFLDQNEDYSLCFHSYYIKEGETLTLKRLISKSSITLEEYAKSLSGPITLTVLFRNILKPIIPKDMMELVTGSFFCFIRLGEQGKFKYINEPMAVHRMHSGGIYSGKSKYEQGIISLKNKVAMILYFKNNHSILKILKRTYVADSMHYIFFFLIRFQFYNASKFIKYSLKFGLTTTHFTYAIMYLYGKIKNYKIFTVRDYI